MSIGGLEKLPRGGGCGGLLVSLEGNDAVAYMSIDTERNTAGT
jgi:hypothetical protein